MRRLAVAALSLALLAACQPATTELTEEQRAEIETEVKALDYDWVASVEAWDLDRYLTFYSDDLVYAWFGEVHRGLSDWRDQVAPSFEEAPSIGKCDLKDLHYQVLTADVVVSTHVMECVGPIGASTLVYNTRTTVWVKRDGEWEIVSLSETFPSGEAGLYYVEGLPEPESN